jgi:predicted acyl esterase
VSQHKTEVRDGMVIEWDAPIKMDDGVVLRADIFRPIGEGKWPIVMSYGPYAKGKTFADSRPYAWKHLINKHPSILKKSSNRYQSWELVDPEVWVPDGYAIVRVDSRGMGRSPGFVDPYSPRETNDLYACIEWGGTQPWCNGKVGLCGISYFATNAWHVAGLQPPHLAAIVVWEGAADHYRDQVYHGGIFSEGRINWYPRAIYPIQHGVGERGTRSTVTGEWVSGPETLPEETLVANRIDVLADDLAHPLDDRYHQERSAKWDQIKVPFLSAGNWGGQGNHLRGNTEGYMCAASEQKWLEIHGDTHWGEFYSDYGTALQKRFLAHFLKGEQNGWDKEPPILLNVRHPNETFVLRKEADWPIPRTQWTKFYLAPDGMRLSRDEPAGGASLKYEALGEGLTFTTEPLSAPLEITGPAAAKLNVSSDTTDTDVFVVVRVFAPDGTEVLYQGAQDPHTPIGHGWLRASHRKLDRAQSLPYRPYHPHDETWPLTPGEPVELDVEIWPTSIVAPAGYRLAITIRGSDYRYPGPPVNTPGLPYPLTGVGAFFHERPEDRPPAVFHQSAQLHFAPGQQPYVLLPVIPDAA